MIKVCFVDYPEMIVARWIDKAILYVGGLALWYSENNQHVSAVKLLVKLGFLACKDGTFSFRYWTTRQHELAMRMYLYYKMWTRALDMSYKTSLRYAKNWWESDMNRACIARGLRWDLVKTDRNGYIEVHNDVCILN